MLFRSVEQLSDSVIIMHDGRSLVQDTVANLYLRTGCTAMEEAFVHIIGGNPLLPIVKGTRDIGESHHD